MSSLEQPPLYHEPYRPQFHYSPPCRWMNDPNGLVFYAGKYHLFYQFHPFSSVWGPMHWGHAVSRDLLHWETQPIALYPDELGMIFSGSIVVDTQNTAGFGANALVAMYSYSTQTQGIAYSLDAGHTWIKYARNPVIGALAHDFRDPKVFWHDATGQWAMVLAAGREIQFFTSPNLLDWTFRSRFSVDVDTGVWEMPDLFPFEVNGQIKWVLLVGIGDGAVAGGSGTMYFVGEFDGFEFHANNPGAIFWLDYGTDHYAGTTWSNAPDKRRLLIGWMSNWRYARVTPTHPWRNAMTIPRELRLVATEDGLRLAQFPVSVESLRYTTLYQTASRTINGREMLPVHGRRLELIAEFEVGTSSHFGLELQHGAHEAIRIIYDAADEQLILRRPHTSIENYPSRFAAPLAAQSDRIRLHILLDESSIEVFAGDHTVVLTAQTFGSLENDGIALFSEGGTAQLHQLDIFGLNSIWKDTIQTIPDYCQDT